MKAAGRRIEFPPYLPSAAWLGAFCREEAESLDKHCYCRTVIESNRPEGMVLSVPIEGGASTLKRCRLADLRISHHGDWPRIHLGAMEAAYGREPYFCHFFPEIAGMIEQYPPSLMMLNMSLAGYMLDCMDFRNEKAGLEALRAQYPERFSSIALQMSNRCDLRHSFIEPLFRFGKDAIFLLLDNNENPNPS